MPFENCVVADSDLHVMEPADLWQEWIDPAFRHAAPVGLSEMKRDMRVRVKNRVILRGGAVRPMKPAPEGGQRTGWRKEHEDAPVHRVVRRPEPGLLDRLPSRG